MQLVNTEKGLDSLSNAEKSLMIGQLEALFAVEPGMVSRASMQGTARESCPQHHTPLHTQCAPFTVSRRHSPHTLWAI